MTLRDEIGVLPDPEFDLELPTGWARQEVDDRTLGTLLSGLRRRCLQNHQPELFAELKTYAQQAFADMGRTGVFAYFAPTDPGEGTLAIPASLNASIRRAEPGTTLDDLARVLIREHAATPLFGDPRTLRFETERTVRMGTNTIASHAVTYLTPVPNSNRRRALSLVAGFGRLPETSPEDEGVQAIRALFDACVSTLRWRAPVQAT